MNIVVSTVGLALAGSTAGSPASARTLGGLESLDLAVLHVINVVWTHPLLDAFFVWLTHPPYEEVYFVAAALALLTVGGRRGRIAVLSIGVAVLLSDQLTASVIKPAVERMRPCFAHPEEVRLLLAKQARSFSFPSAHAANSFAVALVLFGVRRWLGWAMLGMAALIAYSRPYVGVHYPTDMVAGAVLGALLGAGVLIAQRRIEARWSARRATTVSDASDDGASSPDRPAPPKASRSRRRDDP